MSSEAPRLNQVGMPPLGRSIHRRRAQVEAERAEGETPADFRQQIIVSIIAFGAVLLVGSTLIWLVL